MIVVDRLEQASHALFSLLSVMTDEASNNNQAAAAAKAEKKTARATFGFCSDARNLQVGIVRKSLTPSDSISLIGSSTLQKLLHSLTLSL